MVVENWEQYLSLRDSLWGWRSPSLTRGSAAWSTSAEKKSPHNTCIWKTMKIPFIWVSQKAARKPVILLKSPHTKLTSSQALTLDFSRGNVTWTVPETYRDRLSCVIPGWELVGKLTFALCWALQPCSQHAWASSNLCWPLSSHGQLWICMDLVNSTHSTVMIH